jgi:ATP-dependent phosphofructokinase / diphosphate-dependent phosphofructokinase
MSKGNVIVGQSGGPTSVINASLAGIVETAAKNTAIGDVLGMRYGIEGFMAENIIDFGRESSATINGLASTPSSALGSCRHKLKDADLPKILDVIKKYNIRYMFLIGGNDTIDTICRVAAYAKEHKYELIGIGVPKTVDNDLYGTDHTPGFASAARYMALSVQQAGMLARDMKKVDKFVIFQTIGRETGWLAAATTLARRDEDDAPHILVLPERAFDRDAFLSKVEAYYKKFGYVSVVCGEGCKYADGTPVSASQIKDKFNNVEFGAMAGTSVAMMLHRMIANKFGFRGEFQITESLPMCAADRAVTHDIDEAYMAGKAAVELAVKGTTGVMVTLVREEGKNYKCTTGTIPLSEVAVRAKPLPDEFLSRDGTDVTPAFTEYAKPLMGELPRYAKLAYHPYKASRNT